MKRISLDANEQQALITALENHLETLHGKNDEDEPVLESILNRLMED